MYDIFIQRRIFRSGLTTALLKTSDLVSDVFIVTVISGTSEMNTVSVAKLVLGPSRRTCTDQLQPIA